VQSSSGRGSAEEVGPAGGAQHGSNRPRGVVAFVADGPRPDLVHLLERAAREVPELEIHSLFTRSASDFLWTRELPPAIHPERFAVGDDRVSVDRWWGRPGRDLLKARRMNRYLEERPVRALVLNGYSDLTAALLLAGCRRRDIPVFLRGDANARCEPPAGPLRRWLKQRLVPVFLRRCDGVMPFGDFGVEYFTRYGVDPDRCYFVPAVPDFAAFERVEADAVEAARYRHGLRPDRRHLLFCGRLIDLKRVDLLLAAFEALSARRPDWDLVLVGSGPAEPALRARVPASLARRVHWLGHIDWGGLPAIYHACDVLVLPSEIENWGVVVLEALAAGRPLVASDVCQAAADCVADGLAGRLFASGSAADLEAALLEVTGAATLERMKAATPGALEAWRAQRDPIGGLRRALAAVGVLPHPA